MREAFRDARMVQNLPENLTLLLSALLDLNFSFEPHRAPFCL